LTLDSTIDELLRRNYHPYIILEKIEEEQFRTRFDGSSALATLDWQPIARLQHSSEVKIYDTLDRQPAGNATPARTEVIP
jgi:hypothetical protein